MVTVFSLTSSEVYQPETQKRQQKASLKTFPQQAGLGVQCLGWLMATEPSAHLLAVKAADTVGWFTDEVKPKSTSFSKSAQ